VGNWKGFRRDYSRQRQKEKKKRIILKMNLITRVTGRGGRGRKDQAGDIILGGGRREKGNKKCIAGRSRSLERTRKKRTILHTRFYRDLVKQQKRR